MFIKHPSFTVFRKKSATNPEEQREEVQEVRRGRVRSTAVAGVAGCASDADVVSDNISKDADNFKINRRIVAVNGITDKYILSVEGWCNIVVDREDHQLEVTCKVGADGYKKHLVGLSDNTTYFVEQLDAADVSPDHYKVIFKPETIIPDVEVR